MDPRMLHSAIRQCEADCDKIDALLVSLKQQCRPENRAVAAHETPHRSLRRMLSELAEDRFAPSSVPEIDVAEQRLPVPVAPRRIVS